MKFTGLNLSKEILESLQEMSFVQMTPIQERAIPLLLEGKDIIGQADTGTGKTAAFAIPTIESFNVENKEIQALVLCPTRELCVQVAEQFSLLMNNFENYSCVPIYGGQKIETQIKLLKNHPQVIVGTPGRVLDHIKRGSLRLRSVQTVVLDEADKMLEMGFRDDIHSILEVIKDKKQMMLFSATMQPGILALAKKYQNKAQHINLKKSSDNELKIQQLFYTVEYDNKIEAIKRLLFTHKVRSALIFCNRRDQVDKVTDELKKNGFGAAKLHGDLKQNQRDAVMKKFREGEVRILVATDIAGRGIDVDDIDTVFNYSLPRDSQDFVHRIGRTARAGKSGLAISIINKKETRDINRISERHEYEIKEKSIPGIDSLGITSLVSLENTLIDSTLSRKSSKKHLKALKELQKETKEEPALVRKYIKSLSQASKSVLGSL